MSHDRIKFTLRLPSEIARLAAEEAARLGVSRHEFIVRLVTEAVTQADFDPDIVLGFVRLERGEVDAEAECPQCGRDFGESGGEVFIGFSAGRRSPEPFGPICAACSGA